MGPSRKLLLDGEQVLTVTRTHVKVIIVPFLMGLVVVFVGGFLAAKSGGSAGGWLRIVVVVVTVVLLMFTTVMPFLRWYLWTYNLTNLRLIEQRGVLNRTGRVIPLVRVNDVSFEKSLTDRMLGCGTLIIHDASAQQGLRVNDIPHIEDFHRRISTLVLTAHEPGFHESSTHESSSADTRNADTSTHDARRAQHGDEI